MAAIDKDTKPKPADTAWNTASQTEVFVSEDTLSSSTVQLISTCGASKTSSVSL